MIVLPIFFIMGRTCCVPGCTANYRSERSQTVSTFKFPKNAQLREEWIKAIHRRDFIPNNKSVVCARHFDDNLIVRMESFHCKDGHVATVFRGVPKLQDGAVPHIFPNQPKYFSRVYTPRRKRPEKLKAQNSNLSPVDHTYFTKADVVHEQRCLAKVTENDSTKVHPVSMSSASMLHLESNASTVSSPEESKPVDWTGMKAESELSEVNEEIPSGSDILSLPKVEQTECQSSLCAESSSGILDVVQPSSAFVLPCILLENECTMDDFHPPLIPVLENAADTYQSSSSFMEHDQSVLNVDTETSNLFFCTESDLKSNLCISPDHTLVYSTKKPAKSEPTQASDLDQTVLSGKGKGNTILCSILKKKVTILKNGDLVFM